jgi:phosphohistidine phosphatase
MKRLTILRHAKSGWDDPVARDFDRPLNDRGKLAAQLIGMHAARLNLGVDYIWSSPAVRCGDTLDIFLPAADMSSIDLHWDRRIYLASSASLLDVLRDTPAGAQHVLMCGHNPGLEDLILGLVPDDGGPTGDVVLRDSVEAKFPTAALATLDCAVTDWTALADGCATISAFVRPRDLSAELGPEDE